MTLKIIPGLNWCDLKAAYLLDRRFDDVLEYWIERGAIFDWLDDEQLPHGWSLDGHDKSGAAGYVLTFNISTIPAAHEFEAVEALLLTLRKKLLGDES